MQLRDLDYFLTIVEQGRMHRAAERLGLTQPALSKCIARLEKSVGGSLFDRTEKGLRLTAVGQRFTEHAKTLRRVAQQAADDIAFIVKGEAGHLDIGAAPAMTEYFLPGACAQLLETTSGATINVVSGMNDTLIPAVRAGDLDMALSGVPDVAPLHLAQEVLLAEQFVVVSRREHPLARRRQSIELEQLVTEAWVLPSANVLSRRGFNEAFASRKLPAPAAVIETNSIAFMLNVIAMSDTIGFLPQRMLTRTSARAAMRVLPLHGVSWQRKIGVTYRAAVKLPPLGIKLIEILRKHAKAHGTLR